MEDNKLQESIERLITTYTTLKEKVADTIESLEQII